MLLGLLSACDTGRPLPGTPKVIRMDELIVQPMGGFVGAGGPSHMKTEGRVSMSALSPGDRATVDGWFAHPTPVSANFYYRVTRLRPEGSRTVDVAADVVPEALILSVKTVLD